MSPRASVFPHSLGSLRVPILAILAAMGFVVLGGAPLDPSATTDRAEQARAVPFGGTTLDASGGLSAFVVTGERALERRGPRGRVSGGPGLDPDLRIATPAARVPGATPIPHARAFRGRPPTSVSTRDALARAGRLSAPTTAPPTSSS